jgi:hypothetical protein
MGQNVEVLEESTFRIGQGENCIALGGVTQKKASSNFVYSLDSYFLVN